MSKKNTTVKASKVRKAKRVRGQALPALITTSIVLQALKERFSIDESAFVTAYDAVPRHRARKTVTTAQLNAYKTFTEDGNFDAFCVAVGKKKPAASNLISRCIQHYAQNGDS